MHPRNPYRNNPPDFITLLQHYPLELGNVMIKTDTGKLAIDWRNSDSQRALTQVLLLNDFGLRVVLPPDRLCPPLPNRINYLCWISELLDFRLDYQLVDQSMWNTIPILDIGVGASCIYPLLGNKLFHWNFVGSDIDHESLRWAQQLILSNNMQDSIRLAAVDSSAPLQTLLANLPLPNPHTKGSDSILSFLQSIGELSRFRGPIRQFLVSMGGVHAHLTQLAESQAQQGIFTKDIPEEMILRVCMTNPPFYSRDEQIEPNPRTICIGSQTEMITEGGEVGFLLGILADSLILRKRIGWYTSMIGKKSTLRIILRWLRSLGVSHVFSTRFIQGKKGKSTVRWGIAWTFLDVQVPSEVQQSMTHKVFGFKKLRRKRDVSTSIQLFSPSSFCSTIDPVELILLSEFFQADETRQLNQSHAFHQESFLNYLKVKIGDMSTMGIHSYLPPCCTCSNCVIAFCLMRVLKSPAVLLDQTATTSNPSGLLLDRVEIKGSKSLSSTESHRQVKIFLRFCLETLDESEVCVSFSVVTPKVESQDIHVKRRRDSRAEDQPIRKRTKVDSDEDSDSDDESDEEDISQTGINDPSADWEVGDDPEDQTQTPVNRVEFSIYLTQPSTHVETIFSPTTRKSFFTLAELLEHDIIRTNRRWRRLLNKNSELK